MIDFGPRSTAAGVPDDPEGPHPHALGRVTGSASAGPASANEAAQAAEAAEAAEATQIAQAAQTVLAKLTRLASTFRAMPQSKLLGRLPDGRSRAEAGHALADALAKAAQGIEERSSDHPPLWRTVPYAGPFAVGDQLMVLGNEFSDALITLTTLNRMTEPVWSAPDARMGADQVLARMDEQIRTLMLS